LKTGQRKGRELPTVLWLAVRDYLHEWQMSVCFILALAAILAPMMVLFGLKFGIVTGMVDRLVQDPRNREIRPVGSGHFSPAWFEQVRARGDVAFVAPKTRSLAATMNLYRADGSAPSKIVNAELIPSGPGDPMLHPDAPKPQKIGEVIVSGSVARKLEAVRGDIIDGSVARIYRGARERVHLPLQVIGIAPPGTFARDGAFVSGSLLDAVEDYRDGRAVPETSWPGEEPYEGERWYPGFRLFARSIYDVAALADTLQEGTGIEVRTRSADIEIVQSLDRNLSIVFWVVALVALVGFSLSLGASLWANVDRKRRELSVLRLIGVRTGGIIWFPVVQALLTGLFGWLLAGLIYLSVESALNHMFSGSLAFGESICRLLPEHYLGALYLTLASCVVASVLGGFKVSKIEPSEGMREY